MNAAETAQREADAIRPVDYEAIARFLFDVIDEIDTVDDWAKGNDVAYRRNVKIIQQRRFEVVAVCDGYNAVEFKNR